MTITPFAALFPDFSQVAIPGDFCENAKFAYPIYIQDGVVQETTAVACYIYQIEVRHRKHTGFIALNAMSDFLHAKIKKHEKTLREKEEQQKDLFLQWRAQLKPVLVTYPSVKVLDDWLLEYAQHHKPLFTTRFPQDHEIHRVWAVTDSRQILYLQQLAQQHIRTTYIADGHHRASAMALLQEAHKEAFPELDFDHLLCAYFAEDQLDILDYNRVVEGNPAQSPMRLMADLSRIFDIEPLEALRKPTEKHEIILTFRKEWYALRWKTAILAQYPPDETLLDVTMLNNHVLHDILAIKEVRTDTRIIYIDGSKGLSGMRKTMKGHKNRLGFLLYPILFADVMHIADSGETLPPKSTYFEPRLKSGLLGKKLEKRLKKSET